MVNLIHARSHYVILGLGILLITTQKSNAVVSGIVLILWILDINDIGPKAEKAIVKALNQLAENLDEFADRWNG